MSERISDHPAHPSPPAPTKTEIQRRAEFQVMHPGVGFGIRPHCEDGEPWTAYWLDASDGGARHVNGPTLGAVIKTVKPLFGEFGDDDE